MNMVGLPPGRIITSSGDTLLGADDKAGVAEIVSAVAHLAANPQLSRPTLRIAFTPDEEIFGEGWVERTERLVEAGELRPAGGKLMPRRSEFVANRIALRSASADSVAVIERASGEMLGLVEAERAFTTRFDALQARRAAVLG